MTTILERAQFAIAICLAWELVCFPRLKWFIFSHVGHGRTEERTDRCMDGQMHGRKKILLRLSDRKSSTCNFRQNRAQSGKIQHKIASLFSDVVCLHYGDKKALAYNCIVGNLVSNFLLILDSVKRVLKRVSNAC